MFLVVVVVVDAALLLVGVVGARMGDEFEGFFFPYIKRFFFVGDLVRPACEKVKFAICAMFI